MPMRLAMEGNNPHDSMAVLVNMPPMDCLNDAQKIMQNADGRSVAQMSGCPVGRVPRNL